MSFVAISGMTNVNQGWYVRPNPGGRKKLKKTKAEYILNCNAIPGTFADGRCLLFGRVLYIIAILNTLTCADRADSAHTV